MSISTESRAPSGTGSRGQAEAARSSRESESGRDRKEGKTESAEDRKREVDRLELSEEVAGLKEEGEDLGVGEGDLRETGDDRDALLDSLKAQVEDLKKRLAALKEEKEARSGEEGTDKKSSGGAAAGGGAATGASGAAAGSGGSKGPTVGNSKAPAGFLWKPASESNGNLVILLPPGMTGKVASVQVLSPDGQVLASGNQSGVANGGREHFRFGQPGGSFPSGSVVRIQMKDGSIQSIPIQNTGARNEGR